MRQNKSRHSIWKFYKIEIFAFYYQRHVEYNFNDFCSLLYINFEGNKNITRYNFIKTISTLTIIPSHLKINMKIEILRNRRPVMLDLRYYLRRRNKKDFYKS